MDLVKDYIKRIGKQTWYEKIFAASTLLLIGLYVSAYYFTKESKYEKYIPLLMTVRTLFLGFFLIFFYNPLRTSFEYGHSLPLFAVAAGVTLLLLLNKYDILNLAHFILYGDLLPPNPKKVCRMENDPTANTLEEKTKHTKEN